MHNTKTEQSSATLVLAIAEHLAGQVVPPPSKAELIALLKAVKVPRSIARGLWLTRRTKLGIERSADIANFYVVLRTLRLNGRVTQEEGFLSLAPDFVDALAPALDTTEDFTNIPAWTDRAFQVQNTAEFEANLAAALATIRPWS